MYQVHVDPPAARELQRLPRSAFAAVLKILLSLAVEPRPPTAGNLSGVSGGMKQRAGDLRVLYVVDDTARTVTVYRVGNRRDVYR